MIKRAVAAALGLALGLAGLGQAQQEHPGCTSGWIEVSATPGVVVESIRVHDGVAGASTPVASAVFYFALPGYEQHLAMMNGANAPGGALLTVRNQLGQVIHIRDRFLEPKGAATVALSSLLASAGCVEPEPTPH